MLDCWMLDCWMLDGKSDHLICWCSDLSGDRVVGRLCGVNGRYHGGLVRGVPFKRKVHSRLALRKDQVFYCVWALSYVLCMHASLDETQYSI